MKFRFKRVLVGVSSVIPFLLLNTVFATPSPEALSGDYSIHFEQLSKSCGETISPIDSNVSIQFSDSDVTIKFPSGFLGVEILKTSYNAERGTFSDQLSQKVNLGATNAQLTLDVKGKVLNKSGKTKVRFNITFNKVADDPEWNCMVQGKGVANKL